MKNISVLVILLAFFMISTGYANSGNVIEKEEFAFNIETPQLGVPDTVEEEEEKAFPLTFGFDLVSRYIWRGVDFGATPAFQPGFFYNCGNDVVSFEIGAWASYSVTGSFAEMDLYTTVSFPYFWVGLTDYFFPTETAANNNYFDYKKGTGHVYEVMAGVDGPDKVPISFMIALNVSDAGSDPAHDNNTLYFELSYGTTLKKDVGLDVFLGGANGSYYVQKDRSGDGVGDFNIVNVGMTFSKTFNIKNKVVLPLSISLIGNPDAEKVYLVAGIGLWNQ